MTRRERLEAAVGDVSVDIDREQYVDGIERVLDMHPFMRGFREHMHAADPVFDDLADRWKWKELA